MRRFIEALLALDLGVRQTLENDLVLPGGSNLSNTPALSERYIVDEWKTRFLAGRLNESCGARAS
jgi:hypothetical protein